MKDFSKDILHTIEQGHIEPRPRWMFLTRQIALLSGFIFSVLIGGLSVSVILFSLTDLDWDAPAMMSRNPGPFFITYLPYVWVILLGLFGVAAYYEMRNTKSGYRYRAMTILGVSLFASIVIGGALHTFGMGQLAERRFSMMVPQYRGLDARKMNLWMRPGDGMLAGTMVSGSATTTFVLEDFSGRNWTVDAERAVQHGIVGEQVRVIGSVVDPGVFHATDVFPWTRRGPSMMRGGQPMMQQGGELRQKFLDMPRQQGMMRFPPGANGGER